MVVPPIWALDSHGLRFSHRCARLYVEGPTIRRRLAGYDADDFELLAERAVKVSNDFLTAPDFVDVVVPGKQGRPFR